MLARGKRAVSMVSPSLSALLALGLPKCPACLLFLIAPLGIPLHFAGTLLGSVAALLVVIPVAVLALSGCRRDSLGPRYLAIGGSILVLLGRFAGVLPGLALAGVLAITVAVVWSRRTPAHC